MTLPLPIGLRRSILVRSNRTSERSDASVFEPLLAWDGRLDISKDVVPSVVGNIDEAEAA